ncbi:MAG: DUF3783 domain-containing protein [Desulfococcaceae bacterium]
MNSIGFETVSQSDRFLYGPRKLLVCGFPAEVQSKFIQLLEMTGFNDLPTVWISRNQAGEKVGTLAGLPDKSGWGVSSDLPRAIIVCGITEKELHQLMDGCRKSGMKRPLWAVLTTNSENWTAEFLLSELSAERKALEKGKM